MDNPEETLMMLLMTPAVCICILLWTSDAAHIQSNLSEKATLQFSMNLPALSKSKAT